jgi:transcriptional regulator with XRE-family HTH domain
MDLRPAFAANLRRLRCERGFSQCQLALEAGLNRSYLSRLENGRNDAGLKLIGKLADVLGVQAAELITFKGTKAPGKPTRVTHDPRRLKQGDRG